MAILKTLTQHQINQGALRCPPNVPKVELALLIRPDEVLSRIFDMPILKISHHPLRRLLQHRHVRCGRLT